MTRAPLIALALLALCTATGVSARDDYDYGPPPEWNRYKEIAEAGVRARLPDQENWAIEWPNGYRAGPWKHKGRFNGYITCGIMRATGPVTERNPRTQFVVVVDRDEVKTVDIGERDSRTWVNLICDGAVASGGLPPARLMPTAAAKVASAAVDNPATASGLKIQVMSEGAYVVDVVANSAAAKAGVTKGTVITHANGIGLAGMGPAMVQLLGSDTAVMTLDTAVGTRIDLRRAP